VNHFGLLVPANPALPCTPFEWLDGTIPLLTMLYKVMPEGSQDGFDAATVTPAHGEAPGGLRLWCLDNALLADKPEYNDRAIAVCRHFGYNVPALAGPIAFIGAIDGEDEAGLHPIMLRFLQVTLDRVTGPEWAEESERS
jgi:hypothetical protein